MSRPSALIFVDLPGRDLMGDALIAHHLEKLGVECHLEPLESWQAAVYAHKPHLVLFNHLTTKHLADYSQELKSYDILVGSLLNEGLAYAPTAREFVSKKQFPNIHCDLHLCWNDHHRQALVEHEFCTPPEMARTVGCPRFDLYKQPWAQLHLSQQRKVDDRPVILVNATFALALFHTMPRENADRFFADWKDKIDGLKDYMSVVESHFLSRQMLPDHLGKLLETLRYRIILRPHPREELEFYHQWLDGLPPEQRELVSLSVNEPPFRPILESDVVLNCEDCTTAMEAWIADKPTVTIALAQNPYFFTETYKRLSPISAAPETLVPMVEEALANPTQPAYHELRQRHLAEWLYSSDGQSAYRAASEIANLIKARSNQPRIPFSFRTFRKAWKLRLLSALNEPYNSQLKHFLRRLLGGKQEQVSIKYRNYLKAIRPTDVADVLGELRRLDP